MGLKRCAACDELFEAKGNTKRCPACRGERGVLAATRAELAMLRKTGTPLGQAALVLAARLDAGADPGSATVAMAKELRAAMAELGRSAPAAHDPVDELRKRRERRLHA